MTLLLFAAGLLLIVVGLAGLLLPAIPGAPLIFAGSLAIAWSEGFSRIGWFPLTLIAVLAVTGMVLDHAAALLGARKAGASTWGVIGAVVGLLVGLPFGLPGIVLGPAVGATAFEYYKDPDVRRAATAGAGVLVGFLIGTALKYAFAVAMIGVLIASYWL
jgi:hypothetical protein